MTLSSASPLAGYDALLEQIRPRLFSVLRAYRIPPDDAEDLLQQSMLALVYRGDSVRQPDRWLVGVLKKKCLMYWRSRRRRLDEPMDEEALEWLATPAGPAQEDGDLTRDLQVLLSKLPPRYRQLIRLRFWLGLEPQEVARRMGYRPSSIAKITSRCLAALNAQATAVGWAGPESASRSEPASAGLRPVPRSEASDP